MTPHTPPPSGGGPDPRIAELEHQLRVTRHNERHHRERASALAANFARWQRDHGRHWHAVHALCNVQRKSVPMTDLLRALDVLNEPWSDADGSCSQCGTRTTSDDAGDVLRVGDTVQVHEGGTTHHLARVAHSGNLGGPPVIVVPDVTSADPRPPVTRELDVDKYAEYDAQSRAEVIALISRQAKRIAELETMCSPMPDIDPDEVPGIEAPGPCALYPGCDVPDGPCTWPTCGYAAPHTPRAGVQR